MGLLIKRLLGLVCLLQLTAPVNAGPTAQDEGSVTKENPVVIIGASYAKSWDIKRIGGLKVVNAGIDGQQSFELLERFQHDVVDRKPRMVVIWGYINDIHRNPKNEVAATIQRAKESFVRMVELAQENGITPVLVTEVTIRPPEGWTETIMGWIGTLRGKSSYQDYVNQHVRQLNAWLRSYAESEGLQLLDFEPLLADAEGRRQASFATPDGSHINSAAYERLTSYTESHFR